VLVSSAGVTIVFSLAAGGMRDSMTEEEYQRAMEFMTAQQAKFFADMERLKETQDQAERRTARLERIAGLMAKAGLRARQQWRESDERWNRRSEELRQAQAHTDKRSEELRDAQAHSDKRLDALIDIVRQQRNGST
jgi:hypothetical protein